MIVKNYTLDDHTYSGIANGVFDYMYNWEFSGRQVALPVKHHLYNQISNNYAGFANDTDGFLFLSAGYSQGFSIARVDETSEQVVRIYKDGTYRGNSLALDKAKKKAYVGVYGSYLIYEYDYSNIYYSGGTTPSRISLTSSDGLQGSCYIGYGSFGNSLAVCGDYLYYVCGNAYPTSYQLQRWNLSTRTAGTPINVYNTNNYNAHFYRAFLYYDEPYDRLFMMGAAGSGYVGIVIVMSASTSGATAYSIPHSSFNAIPGYYTHTIMYDEDDENKMYLGYNFNYHNYVDITSCLASSSKADYIRPTLTTLPNRTGRYSYSYGNYDWTYPKDRSYYISHNYITLSSGRTFVGTSYYNNEIQKGFDKQNDNKFMPEFLNMPYYPNDNKLSSNSYIKCDLSIDASIWSIFGTYDLWKDIYPSKFTGSTYDINTNKVWSINNYNRYYTRMCEYPQSDHYWWESHSSLVFDSMYIYKRIGDNLVINGGFDTNSDWLFVGSDIYISGGKLNKTGTTTSCSASQDIGIQSGKEYEINFDLATQRTNDNNAFKIGVGDYSTAGSCGTYFGTTQTRIYRTGSAASSKLYLYFPSPINGTVDNVSCYEVEKQNIDACFINHLQDNVMFPHDGATFNCYVSNNAGVDWENYDYTNADPHVFLTRGTELQIKFEVGTNNRAEPPAYIQSKYKLSVDLFVYSDYKIVRVGGKLVTVGGKLMRI